jgi:nicotinate phosphoribosyltransferase
MGDFMRDKKRRNGRALFADMYSFSMMQGYFLNRMDQNVVFDMFFRRQPFGGGFAIFAGLEEAVDEILNIRFSRRDMAYLESLGIFQEAFLDFLKDFRFKGDIYSMREGTAVFPNEPLIRIHGTLMETQLIEGMLLNYINFQSLIATKSARIVLAANGGRVVEFGLRRAHGVDGAISGTRAAYIGGVFATSNMEAGKKLGIPVAGTMAHSWVMSFETELEAFEKYAEIYPDSCVLLADTYDTLNSGTPNAAKVLRKLKKKGKKNFGIRLDSGDLEYLSKESRKILDENGLKEAVIFASNEVDEWIIKHLVRENAAIDAWGVGTKLITGDKDPSLTGVYKLSAKQGREGFAPCMKITNNPEKMSNPGIKEVYRFYDPHGHALGDLICLAEEEPGLLEKIRSRKPVQFCHPSVDFFEFNLQGYAEAKKLLNPIVLNGKRVGSPASLPEIQKTVSDELESLDATHKRLINPHIYKVSVSRRLKKTKKALIKKALGRLPGGGAASGGEID